MVIITFKNGETQVFNEDSPKLITLWKKVESISSVVYGVYMDAALQTTSEPTTSEPTTSPVPSQFSFPSTVGSYIALKRNDKKVKQSEVLKELETSNCKKGRTRSGHYAKNYISRIENNSCIPSYNELMYILLVLEASNEEIEVAMKTYYDPHTQVYRNDYHRINIL